MAEVEIVSHPGEAYSQLWHAFERLSAAFLGILVLGLLAIAFILRRALNPLRAIVLKMEQVANRQFGEPLLRPRTKDLIAVVDGINSMSAHVEESFKQQAKEAQKLRERAYMDPVSHLGNRAFFMGQLNQWLTESSLGGVAILHAEFIKQTYKSEGYEAGDGLVRELADLLSMTINLPNTVIARISTDEFGFVFPNIDENELKFAANSIITCIQDLNADPTGLSKAKASLGVVFNEERKNSTQMLSVLDNALTKAKSNPEMDYGYISSEQTGVIMGKQQWRALVEEAINDEEVTFRFQAANSSWGKPITVRCSRRLKKMASATRPTNIYWRLNNLMPATSSMSTSLRLSSTNWNAKKCLMPLPSTLRRRVLLNQASFAGYR